MFIINMKSKTFNLSIQTTNFVSVQTETFTSESPEPQWAMGVRSTGSVPVPQPYTFHTVDPLLNNISSTPATVY